MKEQFLNDVHVEYELKPGVKVVDELCQFPLILNRTCKECDIELQKLCLDENAYSPESWERYVAHNVTRKPLAGEHNTSTRR